MPNLVMKSIGIVISFVALFSVPAAGRLAFNIFASAPPRRPASGKEAELLMQAAPRLQAAKRKSLLIDGAVVAAFEFLPQGAAAPLGKVLVVHGYKSRTEHMLPIIDGLTDQGYRVVSIDLPGHGHSTGRQSHLLAGIQAVDVAWREFDGFDGFVGHSFGGATVIAAAAGSIPGIPARTPYKLVTIAAPTKLQVIFSWFAKATGLSPRVKTAFYNEVLKLTGKPLSAFDTAADLPKVKTDALILHAPDDKEVPFVCAEALGASGPHVQMMPLPGLGHRRILAAPTTISAVVEFMEEKGARQGSKGVAELHPARHVA